MAMTGMNDVSFSTCINRKISAALLAAFLLAEMDAEVEHWKGPPSIDGIKVGRFAYFVEVSLRRSWFVVGA